MTAQEYAAIAAACDQLLRAPEAGLERLAVPLLHLIKEHPSCLRQYQPPPRVGGASGSRSPARALAAAARAAIRALLRSVRATAASLTRKASGPPVQVLLVSHLTSPAQLQGGDDAYFGSLQQLLQSRGINSSLLLVDHLRDDAARRECAAPLRGTRRQLLPRAVPVATELRIWWRCLLSRRRLRREASAATDPWVRSIAVLAAGEMVHGQTLANLRLHETLAGIFARLRPSIVITTHEGDACERVIWHAARTMRRQPLCVGYQHALLLPHAHAIRRCVGGPRGASDPDVILTLGLISHTALAASANLRRVRLIEYGSHRHARVRVHPPWSDRPHECLVLPDAEESECVVLFDFALECAERCPEMMFVLRPHPIVDFQGLAQRHPNLRVLPPNVRLSSQTLVEDCTQARYCLYRGSSAALHAALFGAKPFYLARPDEMVFDPLFTLGEWRETVNSPAEFVRRTLRAEAVPDLSAAQRARDECDRYICAVRPGAIDELLALAQSSHRGQAPGGEFVDRFA